MNKLTMPMNTCFLTADYKHPKYLAYYGYNHWGWDLGNNDKTAPILASAPGEIVVTGYDNTCGNVLIVLYNGVTDRNGKSFDVIARYLHLSSIMCKEGDRVKSGQVIGRMGNTGAVTSGPHLHIEFDTDIRPQYYTWTPTVKGSNILKNGKSNTVVDPKQLLTIGPGQTLTLSSIAWGESEDIKLPVYQEDEPDSTTDTDYKVLYEQTAVELEKTTAERDVAIKHFNDLKAGLLALLEK